MLPIRDTIPVRCVPYAVRAIILINVAAFLYQLSLPPQELERLLYLYGVVPARFLDPEWARDVGYTSRSLLPFLTCMFLHGGWLHILGNMWTLWIFGDNVEDRMGPVRFLVFYLLCGSLASAAHLLTEGGSEVPVVGASGAIAGVMGAYFVMYPTARVVTLIPILFYPLFIELPAFFFLAFWFYMQVFSGLDVAGLETGVAWWAHVGGFVAGMLTFSLFLRRRRARPRFP